MYKAVFFISIASISIAISGYINQKIINAKTLDESLKILFDPRLIIAYGLITPALILLSYRGIYKCIKDNYWLLFLIMSLIVQISNIINGYVVSKQKPSKQMLVCLILNLIVTIIASIPLPERWTN